MGFGAGEKNKKTSRKLYGQVWQQNNRCARKALAKPAPVHMNFLSTGEIRNAGLPPLLPDHPNRGVKATNGLTTGFKQLI